jgi:hypothetical protein
MARLQAFGHNVCSSMAPTSLLFRRAVSLSFVSSLALVACSGGSGSATPVFDAARTTTDGGAEAAAQSDAAHPTTTDGGDAGSRATEGGATDATTAADAGVTRNAACTPTSQQNGTAVDSSHGRLDGTLVYVVPVDQGKQCNGDNSHVHLQVEVSGEVYDIAVDIGTAPNDEVGYLEETMAVPGGAWAEGWHGDDTLSYPTLGIHSTAFGLMAPDIVSQQVLTLLANTSKISIFCTGYSQGNGCHDVHYENGSGKDGAIVLDPTAATSPIVFFRFATPSF